MSNAVPGLSAEQIKLVQETFKKVVPIKEQAASMFYARLFETQPRLKTLFKGSLPEQGRKLMTALGAVVSNLNNLGAVAETIRQLGERHVGYGVKPADYEAVGAALLWTLEKGLGAAFTPEVKIAWINAYGIVADAMKRAAAAAPRPAA
jgi:hemoglobin-like flavoprotein